MMGLLFLLIAAGVGVESLHDYFTGQALTGFTTVILLMLITASLVMISLGVIGEYVAQIYQEVKFRPRYLIRDRIEAELAGITGIKFSDDLQLHPFNALQMPTPACWNVDVFIADVWAAQLRQFGRGLLAERTAVVAQAPDAWQVEEMRPAGFQLRLTGAPLRNDSHGDDPPLVIYGNGGAQHVVDQIELLRRLDIRGEAPAVPRANPV